MKNSSVTLLLSAVLLAPALRAQDADTAILNQPTHRLRDCGADRDFEIARDELVITDRTGSDRVMRFTARTTNDDLARFAESHESATGEEAGIVLYERGVEHKPANRRMVTTGVLVRIAQGADAEALARTAGARVAGRPGYAQDYVLLDAGSPRRALALAQRLRGSNGVQSSDPLLARQQAKRFIPNDPLFTQQWHLRNTAQNGGTAGMDIKPLVTWDTWRGAGIRIGIVDDGLQTAHPDLVTNVDTASDYDWNGGDADPNPGTGDDHGTACAGVAAARGNNSLGVSGAAPEATLVGLRLIAAGTTDQQEADAMNYRSDIIHIKSNSWGPNDDGKTLEAPGALTKAALANACTNGRGGRGTIFTWAAGNGGDVGDNSNYDGYANSIHTIAVGAVNDRGAKSYYSEPGANVVICTPSNDDGRQGITTVDRTGANGYSTGDYANDFGGTSSASPLAAGGIALLLHSKPTLGWRDVQEIVMKTATKCSPTDSDWVTNAAGFQFNHKFGAGLLNVDAAVNLAKTWTNLGTQTSATSTLSNLSAAIPDNNTTGISRTFSVTSAMRVEHVTVQVNITHANRGDLEVSLRSPGGTVSKLSTLHTDSGDNFANWTFMSVRNWGEASAGTWTLTVKDLRAANTGTLSSATLTVHGSGGSTTPPPPPPPPPASNTKTFTSTDVPKSIPDNNTTGITSVNNVTATGKVTALTVSCNITHPYKGDLKVTLISPAGTQVVIHNRSGGSADNVVISNLSLSNFNTQTAAGTWKLKVQDLAAADVGTLKAWSLTITSQ